jgi:hypothetical protein
MLLERPSALLFSSEQKEESLKLGGYKVGEQTGSGVPRGDMKR